MDRNESMTFMRADGSEEGMYLLLKEFWYVPPKISFDFQTVIVILMVQRA